MPAAGVLAGTSQKPENPPRMNVVVLVVGLVLLFAVIFAVVIVGVSAAAKKSEAAARAEFPNARRIESGALFFGQESRGAAQARGNGTLIFTDDELVFKQWVVNRDFRIPYRSIQSIDSPKSFLGKTQGVALFCVRYTNESGEEDAMAWRVKNLSETTRALEEARAG